jgi:hypothetical protein
MTIIKKMLHIGIAGDAQKLTFHFRIVKHLEQTIQVRAHFCLKIQTDPEVNSFSSIQRNIR